jgi:DNA-binding transcriptional LysR family regulator
LLEDLRALVEFAQAGSIAGAADRLFRTPSAVTRQLQRLEAALGAELLDRSVKPPRLNSLGSRVLEQARDLLQRTEAMKSLASRDTEPLVATQYRLHLNVCLVTTVGGTPAWQADVLLPPCAD